MTKESGDFGELLAEKFLKRKGYVLVERNFFSRYGEIDLVMKDDWCLVFVEVKLRRNLKYGSPLEAIDWRKQQKMRKTIFDYLSEKNYWEEWRVDVVGILEKENGSFEFTHLQQAF